MKDTYRFISINRVFIVFHLIKLVVVSWYPHCGLCLRLYFLYTNRFHALLHTLYEAYFGFPFSLLPVSFVSNIFTITPQQMSKLAQPYLCHVISKLLNLSCLFFLYFCSFWSLPVKISASYVRGFLTGGFDPHGGPVIIYSHSFFSQHFLSAFMYD